jgi:hypothetical protein
MAMLSERSNSHPYPLALTNIDLLTVLCTATATTYVYQN